MDQRWPNTLTAKFAFRWHIYYALLVGLTLEFDQHLTNRWADEQNEVEPTSFFSVSAFDQHANDACTNDCCLGNPCSAPKFTILVELSLVVITITS